MQLAALVNVGFESSVIQDGSKTYKASGTVPYMFESSVIQDGSKPIVKKEAEGKT